MLAYCLCLSAVSTQKGGADREPKWFTQADGTVGHTASAEGSSGSCGDNAVYEFNPETGVLTISGTGNMHDYPYCDSVPWDTFRHDVKKLVIGEGITSAGSYCFYSMTELKSAELPDTVEKIGAYSFFYCLSLTAINLPSTLKTIGVCAFGQCEKLASVNLPDSLTTLATRVFQDCKSLESVAFPSSIDYMGDYMVSGCTSLRKVEFRGQTTGIGANAFQSCTSLAEINLPSSVEYIGQKAFYECTSLKGLTFPDGLKAIELEAFAKCTSLTSITLPANLTSIRASTFQLCTSLAEIVIPDENPTYKSVNGFVYDKESADLMFVAPAVRGSFQIEEGTKRILASALQGCSKITSITLPSTLTEIQEEAFEDCSGLKSLVIPDSVTTMGTSVFKGCARLESMTLSSGISAIDAFAFENCTSLRSLVIPDGVESIGRFAFKGCALMTSITIPSKVTELDYAMFDGCEKLAEIVFSGDSPSFVFSSGALYSADYATLFFVTHGVHGSFDIDSRTKTISKGALMGCTALTSVTIPDGIEAIGSEAFSKCTGLTSIAIPAGIVTLESYVFLHCTGLKSVTIPDTVTTVNNCAFEYCTGLTEMKLPSSVTYIATAVFHGCENLRKFTFESDYLAKRAQFYIDLWVLETIEYGDGVTTIGSLRRLHSLKSVTIGKNVQSIDGNPFTECKNMNAYIVAPENEVFAAHDGCLYSKDLSVLLSVPGGKEGGLRLNEKCMAIGDSSLAYCNSLTSVHIPGSVFAIGNSAFAYSSNLSRVDFEGVKEPEHGENVFMSCTKLESVYVPLEYEGETFLGLKVERGIPAIEAAEGDTTEPTNSGPSVALIASLVAVAVVVVVVVVVVAVVYTKKAACFSRKADGSEVFVS